MPILEDRGWRWPDWITDIAHYITTVKHQLSGGQHLNNINIQNFSWLKKCGANCVTLSKQAEKLKSREMKEGWMKSDEGWMKNDERWMMKDEGCWFQAVEGFWLMTDVRTFVIVESLSRLKRPCKWQYLSLLEWVNLPGGALGT